MLGVGEQFPAFPFRLQSASKRVRPFRPSLVWTTRASGRYIFFWPKDFTFRLPHRDRGLRQAQPEFQDRDAQFSAASTDSEFVHLAWRQHHADLKDLPFPMLADIKRELCAGAGHPRPKEGVAQRATFVVDPENMIRFVSVNDLSVGRQSAGSAARAGCASDR